MIKRYLATRYQRRFWLEWKLKPHNITYNTSLIYRLNGPLNFSALENALNGFINEYDEGCRSFFLEENHQLYQLVYDHVEVNIDLEAINGSLQEIELGTKKFIERIHGHLFNLEEAPLFKFGLIKQSNTTYILIMNFHHIISDAHSAKRFIQYISQLYNYYACKAPITLPSSLNFEAYRVFESKQLNEAERSNANIEYWLQLLKGKNLYVDLPTQKIDRSENYQGSSIYFTLGSEVNHSLRQITRQQKTTLFIGLSAVFSILLYKYTGKEQIVLNYPVDSRPPGLKNLIGCFVNNFPLLADIKPEMSFIELMQQLTSLRKNSKQYQNCTLTEIVQGLRRDTLYQGENFFNVSIIEAYFDSEPLLFHELEVTSIKLNSINMDEDLSLAYQASENLTCRLNYRTALFTEEFIKNMILNFHQLIDECVKNNSKSISALNWLHEQQRQAILQFSSSSYIANISLKTVLDFFAESSQMYPENFAVVFNKNTMTYQSLNKKSSVMANILCHKYREKFCREISSDVLIGLYMERNSEMAVSILGILKAGAAYLPLDIKYPQARLKSILKNSQAKIIVTQQNLLETLSSIVDAQDYIFVLPEYLPDTFTADDKGILPYKIKADDLAYVIYTSGSTGEPKGVMVEHGSLSNTIHYFTRYLHMSEGDIVVSLTAVSFDIFGLEFWCALSAGCRLYLVEEDVKNDAYQLKDFLDTTKPTIIQGTPALWALLATVGWKGNKNNLTILCGGESLSPTLTEYLLSISKRVVQVYGPTETTIWSSCKEIKSKEDFNCIGGPIANTDLYVLDADQQILPVGVPGELYIGGQGVARGYLNQPNLTTDRFINLRPGSISSGLRFYRTGDRVCWDMDGQLIFLGRMDFQVKIRGYRIELVEIEMALSQHPDIESVAVIVHEDKNEKKLIAYVSFIKNKAVSLYQLREHLLERLPVYMIPEVFIPLSTFPLTINGKIDRHSLPSPINLSLHKGMPPRNAIEERLLAIWQEVLKQNDIGIHDNFFQLGGHSLAATQVIARLRCEYSNDIPIKTLFKYSSVAELAEYLEHESKKNSTAVAGKYDFKSAEKTSYALSPAQKRLWFIDQYEGGKNKYYNIFTAQCLVGQLNNSALTAAINKVIERHDSLRTIFPLIADQPQQVITKNKTSVVLQEEKINKKQLNNILTAEINYIFNLSTGPLYRFRLLRINENEHVLIAVFHHIIIDGWSLRQIGEEISEYYTEQLAEREINTLANPKQYIEFSEWQLHFLQSDYMKKLIQYWESTLQDYTDLQLPLDYPRPAVRSYHGAHLYFNINSQTCRALNELASQQKTTLFAVLLSVYAILLHRYSYQEDMIIGTPIANRTQQEFEKVVGLVANTLALRIKLNKQISFVDFLQEVMLLTIEAYTHQELPFEQLIDMLKVDRDTSRNPLVQVMLVLQNMSNFHKLNLHGLNTENILIEDEVSKLDLTLTLQEEAGELKCVFEYSTDIFNKSTIQRMSSHFINILKEITACPQKMLSKIQMISDSEIQSLAASRSDNYVAKGHKKTLCQIFHEHVIMNPHNIAVSFNHIHITYIGLDERANQVAYAIRDCYSKFYGYDLGSDTLIGLCTERSLDLIVGILGILKAGGAYVPLDPNYPDDRLRYMIEDSGVQLLLTQAELISSHPALKIFNDNRCIRLDVASDWCEYSMNVPPSMNNINDLAYVIYTSGSTGQPKGVLLSHHNVVRLFKVCDNLFNFSSNDVWTLFHSYAFDFSVWEIWGALLHGGRLVVVPYSISRNPLDFYNLVCKEKVTILNQTPSAFSQFIKADQQTAAKKLALKYVIFGGEALNISTLKPWWDKYADNIPQLINMYGITETTVHVTYRKLIKQDLNQSYSHNIGKPLADLSAYVLDGDLNIVPIGVPGELYIGGAGLARGYHKNQTLTAKAFIQKFNIRLYKTGDQVRWLENGDLEYLCRLDHQVKIRGFRIELTEIEAAMLKCAGIYKAIVVVDSATTKRLIAYYLSNQPVSEETIFQLLKKKLPDYMVPSIYIQLDNVPLTINGKIDYKKLPKPKLRIIPGEGNVPQSDIEKLLAKVWGEVLQVGDINVHANFFSIGGDSIRTIQIVENARKYELNFTPKDLFQYPTISQLARYLEKNKYIPEISPVTNSFSLLDEQDKRLLESNIEDAYPLSALQEGMIFYSELDEQSSSYIDVVGCFVIGVFDEGKFFSVIKQLMEQNPILRASFNLSTFSEYLQLIHRITTIPYKVIDLRGSSDHHEQNLIEWLERERKIRFELDKSPLWRMTIHLLDGERFHFSFTCHHAILDGWSVAKFLTEIFSNYDLILNNRDTKIFPLRSTYRDFIAYEKMLRNDKAQQKFWLKHLKDIHPTLIGNAHKRFTDEFSRKIKRVSLNIDQKSSALHHLSSQLQVSVETLLLAVHLKVLSLVTRQTTVVTGIANHGRSANGDGADVLGLFLNTTPLKIFMDASLSWAELVILIQAEKQAIYSYRNFPLGDIHRLVGSHELFDSLFNFINFHIFSQLKNLLNIQLIPSIHYEETNYVLVSQASVNPADDSLEYTLIFDENVINEDKITIITQLFDDCLNSIIHETTIPFSQSEFLSKRGFALPLKEWCVNEIDYPDVPVQQLFVEQVLKSPNKIAVYQDETKLTYSELNDRANQIANALRKSYYDFYQQELSPDTLIGLCVEQGMDVIVGILAILKAGGAYVPIDPGYPAERLRFQFKNSGIHWLLTQSHIMSTLASIVEWRNEQSLFLDIPENWQSFAKFNPVLSNTGRNLAYVIYTSGSTGKPKGVMIEHHSISRLVKNTNFIKVTAQDHIAQAASIAFDASTFEIWSALLTGATLVCVSQATLLDEALFSQFLLRNKITILWLTARLFDQFILNGRADLFKNLTYLLVGGEALNKSTINQLLSCMAGRPKYILNGYGPTENTTFTTVHSIDENSLKNDSIPIGKVISNTEVYVLNEQHQPVSVGVTGELYIGGAGLARGYYDDEELTRKRFIYESAVKIGKSKSNENIRLYQSGDLVCWLPDGNLEFLGRVDRQVKIRGYRIELDEIESTIKCVEGVTQCAVTINEINKQKKIIAYCMLSPSFNEKLLRNKLQDILPVYSMPIIITVNALPLNMNGKIAYDKLPDPLSIKKRKRSVELFLTENEEKLIEIWLTELPVDVIDINDNFFDLGGDSLMAMKLHTKIQLQFTQKISIVDLFRYPTIKNLAQFLQDSHPETSSLMTSENLRQRHSVFKEQQQRMKLRKYSSAEIKE